MASVSDNQAKIILPGKLDTSLNISVAKRLDGIGGIPAQGAWLRLVGEWRARVFGPWQVMRRDSIGDARRWEE